MNRALTALRYLVLLPVVLSTGHSVWVGLVEKARYRDAIPGVQGLLYWTTLLASILADVNSILRLVWS